MRNRSVPLVHLSSLITNSPAPSDIQETAVLAYCAGALVAFELDDAEVVADNEPDSVPDAWQLPWVCGVVEADGSLVPVIDLNVLSERLVDRVQL